MNAFEILQSRFEGMDVIVSQRENDGAQVDVRNLDMQSGINFKDQIESMLPNHIVGGAYPIFVIALRPKTKTIVPDMRK